MGLFWDLLQQSQISEQRQRSSSLDARVGQLERDLERLHALVRDVIKRLEEHLGEDLDRDGRVGS
jgi:hypothetical protein